jgi:hypothetical protein
MHGKLVGMAVGMLLCWGVAAHGQYRAPADASQLLKLQYFHRYDAATETLQLDEIQEITETHAISETTPDGRVQTIPKQVIRQVIDRRSYQTKDVRALSPKGDVLKIADVVKQLELDEPVVVVQQGKKLPAGYVKLLRDDVVVIEVPSAAPDTRFSPAFGSPPPAYFAVPPVAPVVPAPDTRPRLSSPPVLPLSLPKPGSEDASRF